MRILLAFSLLVAGCVRGIPAPEPTVEATAVEVRKSPLDQREYAYVELDNGLRALLISDPDTDMAAAALSVHAGHYADPVDRQGLAHFLEHMLFLGTDRYPEVDGYRKFVRDHGGWTNASTSGESTRFAFQVEHPYLDPAFDRFARFFVAPVLDAGYVDRERGAVDAEYSLKIQEHGRRIRQVRKVTTNPKHPESKFSVGNLDTLGDREGAAVRDDLLALYAAEYRPDRMTLAILGREPLDTLRGWVVERLGEVSGGSGERGERPPPFREDQLGVRIDAVPLDERRELELQFPLPPQQPLWPSAPHSYVSRVLGHEGEGTLFARLKERGWIEWLHANAGSDGADDHDLFTVRIGLTREGAEQIDTIVAACFDAIALLRDGGVEAFRHEEARRQAALAFTFGEELPPTNAVYSAAWALRYFPPEHALDHWSVAGAFHPDPVHRSLEGLTVDRLRLLVVLPEDETDAVLDRVEPLYDVSYGIRPLTSEEREAFLGGTDLDLALPGPNPYLPERTDLKPGGEAPGLPVRLSAEGDPVELWHLHDTSFGVPRAMGTLHLFSPAPRADGIRSWVLAELFEDLLQDSLEEFRYPMQEAGVGFSVSGTDRGLYLQFWGYDDRQAQLLRDLFERMRSLRVDPDRFAVKRARLVRGWRNRKQRRPIDQARWAAGEALDPHDPDPQVAVPLAEALTAEELQAWIDGFWDPLSARLLLHGNHTADDARTLGAVVSEVLLSDATPSPAIHAVRRLIPPGTEVVRELAIDHDDSALVVRHLAADESLASQARWRLLGQLLSTPYFTELRTEQQLGYVVSAGYTAEDRLPGLQLSIQSTVAGPVTLLERSDAFLAAYHRTLASMPVPEFEAIRAGLAARLREGDTMLYQRTSDLRRDLYAGVLTFDQHEQVARVVEGLDRDAMVAFYQQVLLSKDRGRLVVRSFGRAHADERERTATGCVDEACLARQLPDTVRRSLTTLGPPPVEAR